MTFAIIGSIIWAIIIGFLVFGEIRSIGTKPKRMLQFAAIWMALITILYGAMLYRAEISGGFARAWSDISGEPQISAEGTGFSIDMAGDGHFWVNAHVGSNSVRLLVDSGASVTAFSPEDAQTLGIIENGGMPVMIETANGTVMMDRASVGELRVGSVIVRDFPVLIARNGETSVLGMNWLSRMRGWRVESRRLTIEQ